MAQNGALLNLTQYFGARFTAMMLGLFPVNANLRTARAVGALLYKIDRKHRKRALEPHRAFIKERIGQMPHLTLHRLKDELAGRGVSVSHNAVWLFLRREGLRFKKNAVRP